jgi:hypothetical protein
MANNEVLTIKQLETDKAAQAMVRRLNKETFPSPTSVGDTVQRNCSLDRQTRQLASQRS